MEYASTFGEKCGNDTVISIKALKDCEAIHKRIYLFIDFFFRDPKSRKQIVQFLGVGILNTIVGYGMFFLLVNYLYYLLALLFAHITGVIHSFLWNKYWIFKLKKFQLFEFVKFNLIYAVVFIVNAIALFVSVDIIHMNPKLAQLVLLPVITLISFFGQKLWTFGDKIDNSDNQI
jgi:putative flippase GtrA